MDAIHAMDMYFLTKIVLWFLGLLFLFGAAIYIITFFMQGGDDGDPKSFN